MSVSAIQSVDVRRGLRARRNTSSALYETTSCAACRAGTVCVDQQHSTLPRHAQPHHAECAASQTSVKHRSKTRPTVAFSTLHTCVKQMLQVQLLLLKSSSSRAAS